MLFSHHAGAILGVAVSPIAHLAVTAGEDGKSFLFVVLYFVKSVLQESSLSFQLLLKYFFGKYNQEDQGECEK